MEKLRSYGVANALPKLVRALTLRLLPLFALPLDDGVLAAELPLGAGSANGSVAKPALRKLDDALASPNSFRIIDVTN